MRYIFGANIQKKIYKINLIQFYNYRIYNFKRFSTFYQGGFMPQQDYCSYINWSYKCCEENLAIT